MTKHLFSFDFLEFSYDDHTGVTSTIKSEKLEIVDDDEEDDETLRAVSELDGSETETQVGMSLDAKNRLYQYTLHLNIRAKPFIFLVCIPPKLV